MVKFLPVMVTTAETKKQNILTDICKSRHSTFSCCYAYLHICIAVYSTQMYKISQELFQSYSIANNTLKSIIYQLYPAISARHLGIIFDENFNFRSHICAICSAWFYHIRDLWRIRRYLDLNGAKLLANALVSSRLDYCS